MTNAETAAHLLEWVTRCHGLFSWPTDGCGYEQHIKFSKHRNNHWTGGTQSDFRRFVIDYANALRQEEAKDE